MADELTRRGQQTLRELVQWLVEWCVLGQAIRVAYEKSGTSGRVKPSADMAYALTAAGRRQLHAVVRRVLGTESA